MVDFGEPRPVIHKSLQTLILVFRIPWIAEITNTLGEIVCPELRRLEILAPFSELLSSTHLRPAQKLSELFLVYTDSVTYDEEGALFLNEKWADSIVELLRSIGTIKHVELESEIGVVSVLAEKLEADPTLCPDVVSLHAESCPPCPPESAVRAPKRERSLLLKLEARVSERYRQLRSE